MIRQFAIVQIRITGVCVILGSHLHVYTGWSLNVSKYGWPGQAFFSSGPTTDDIRSRKKVGHSIANNSRCASMCTVYTAELMGLGVN